MKYLLSVEGALCCECLMLRESYVERGDSFYACEA